MGAVDAAGAVGLGDGGGTSVWKYRFNGTSIFSVSCWKCVRMASIAAVSVVSSYALDYATKLTVEIALRRQCLETLEERSVLLHAPMPPGYKSFGLFHLACRSIDHPPGLRGRDTDDIRPVGCGVSEEWVLS